MDLNLPIIAVIGGKKSGKTTVVEFLVKAFTSKGFKVATAKHISSQDFSLDKKGTDTWRHYIAGAKKVISVSNFEIALLIRDYQNRFELNVLKDFIIGADLLLLEGFSKQVNENSSIGKIICVKSEELAPYKKSVKGEIIVFCSMDPNKNSDVLGISRDQNNLFENSMKFFIKTNKLLKILNALPRINCRKCRYQNCEEMAIAIYNNRAKINDCETLRNKERAKIKIEIDKEELPLNPFVSDMIYGVTMSMLSSLKRTSIEEGKKLHIKVT
ncbi:MAG: molybdopterin-guanine dinucleotide biosynthesis protein B [Candidatus Bathyarchaeota archaeon]|nr:molybdopterin-guanine dinucleotide biosynthesis protein B [Candidatus Bathyarchaeota archaeon]